MPINIIYKEDIARTIAVSWQCTSESELKTLVGHMSIRRFKKNDTIYHEQDNPTRIFFLVRGKVKIVKESGLGRAQIVRAVKEGEFFGFRAFFANERYATSTIAFEDSTIAALPLKVLATFISTNTHIAQYFIHELANMLGIAGERIISLTQKHIRGRLADTILVLKESYGYESDNATLAIVMNRDDLASMSNMSTSNAIRTLSAFAQEGLLSIAGKRIKIIDEEQLKKISKLG